MFQRKFGEKIKTQVYDQNSPLPENRAVYGKIVQSRRDHMTIWRMRAGYLNATNTRSEYVMLIACS